MKNINKVVLYTVAAILIIVGTLIYISKNNLQNNLNHNFIRKSIKHTLIKLYETDLNNIDAANLKLYKSSLYLYDLNSYTLLQYNLKGQLIKTIGSVGNKFGQYQLILSLTTKNDSLYTFDPRNKNMTIWDIDGNPRKIQKTPEKFGRAIYLTDAIALFKIPIFELQDDEFLLYNVSANKAIKQMNILSAYHDRGIANDGFFVTNQKNIAFHICYYTKNLLCFNKTGLLYKASTVDNNNKPPQAVKGEGSFSPPSNAVEINREAAINNQYLYIESSVFSNSENKEVINKSSVIDVYAVENNGKYLYSFYVPNYKGKKVDVFAVDEEKLVIIQGQHLTIYNL